MSTSSPKKPRTDRGEDDGYSTPEACTNMAESLFSRLRRAEIGTHHHIAGPYLNSYADEMAWREDNRRKSNGAQYLNVVTSGIRLPVSRQWKPYWQRSAVFQFLGCPRFRAY